MTPQNTEGHCRVQDSVPIVADLLAAAHLVDIPRNWKMRPVTLERLILHRDIL